MPKPHKRNPFLRLSFLGMLFRMPYLLRHWQVGDGREDRLLRKVLSTARPGDISDAIRVIDEFGYEDSFLMNVGDEKGVILDAAVRRANPTRVLELGAYCGYSALRMAAAAPAARVTSVEFSAANADISRQVWAHAGVGDRIEAVVGTLGDGGATIQTLNTALGFGPKSVDLVFIDHAKDAYLPDLKRILENRWLRDGAIVVADNVRFPGAPDYRAFMDAEEGKRFRTDVHETHMEYQSVLKDIVLVSEYLGG